MAVIDFLLGLKCGFPRIQREGQGSANDAGLFGANFVFCWFANVEEDQQSLLNQNCQLT